ncbi:YtxH domain-containing protein [Flavobacterium chuncheonense]|jgi:gas vesicle protein|uniref:YtxH domain-containing protein n=1 Tax=Flavobacterium chuncheonense TaxID=2026653 RepID=A0ABW5YK22_9FLAO
MGRTSQTILGVMVGAAIGTVVGILLAPEKGEDTRKKILDNANAFKDKVKHDIDEISKKVSSEINTKKATLEEELESVISDTSYKAEDLISSLEKKLAELKAKNKKYQK